MSRIFEIDRNPYDEKKALYRKEQVEFIPGVTVLVGCNGSGKTTLLDQIEKRCKKQNLPVMKFDNLTQGGESSRSRNAFEGNMELFATQMLSSEGENIVMNMGVQAAKIGNFVRTGQIKDRKSDMDRAFRAAFCGKSEAKTVEISNERWILLDAIDSGLSVDNVVDIKEYLFKTIMENTYGNEVYILVVANEYEMCSGERCFDVYNGEYTSFLDYYDYRKFILKSRKQKDKRYGEK